MEDRYTELYEKLYRLQWLLRQSHMQNHFAHGPFADRTRGQGRVLAMLKMQPEISSKDLSYLLGIRQQSLNELLNKLEKSGYVVREPSEADRRIMLVKLTEKGKVEQQPDTDYSEIFDCLNPKEQAAFSKYLDRIIAVLQERVVTDEDDEEQANWEKAARARFGNERFEQMMSSRGGFGAHDHAHFGRDFFDGRTRDVHGPATQDMPGAERFNQYYQRGKFAPFDGHLGGKRNSPPPAPPHKDE